MFVTAVAIYVKQIFLPVGFLQKPGACCVGIAGVCALFSLGGQQEDECFIIIGNSISLCTTTICMYHHYGVKCAR
jgi:hypothetical protein